MQTTVWVDSVLGDDGNSGSSLLPYSTISKAAEVAKAMGGDYLIKVIEGDYTQAHEIGGGATTPGYPIVIDKSDIRIEGTSTDSAHYPRLGGDVADSGVDAIIRIDVPSGSNLVGISLNRLHFVGEDTAGEDAPSAIHVYSDEQRTLASSGASNCTIERSEMNASFEDGRPSVLLETAGGGSLMQFTLSNCEIWCSNRGGAEVRIATPTGDPGQDNPLLIVDECQVLIAGNDDAMFGLGFTTEEDSNCTGDAGLKAHLVIIHSTGASEGHGIETGLGYWLAASDGTLVHPLANRISRCEIKGCLSDAVLVHSREEGSGTVNIVLPEDDFSFNKLHHNGGAGIHLDWGESGGYVNVKTENNLIYRNEWGIWYQGVNEDIDGQLCGHQFETICMNQSYAFRMDGSGTPSTEIPGPFLNSVIVWQNNAGGSYIQNGGTLTWDPQVEGQMKRSCWQNLSSPVNRNTNANPNLANTASDDYHLTSSSTTCIDLGDNYPAGGLPPFDLDREDRTVNGNAADGDEVDKGCDEYDP